LLLRCFQNIVFVATELETRGVSLNPRYCLRVVSTDQDIFSSLQPKYVNKWRKSNSLNLKENWRSHTIGMKRVFTS